MRRALLTFLLVATACWHSKQRGDFDPYQPVGLRPDNAAKPTPPAGIQTTALAVGAAAPPVAAPSLPAHDRLVLVFYRGDWCPYCRGQLRDLEAHLPDLAQRKAALVAISVDSAETDAHLADGLHLTFPLVSDPGHHVIERYGVYDGETELLAWPAIFVVDRENKIAWRWIADDFKKRITTTELLAALDGLAPR